MSRTFEILHGAQLRSTKIETSRVARPPLPASSAPEDIRAGVESEIRNLVQGLIIAQGQRALKTVAFCGINEGAGCSWVCARAAEAVAALSSGRVCVVDANIRNPTLHDQFRVENVAGFADALADPRPVGEFVRRTWSERLWLMTSGSAPSNPDGMLDPERLRRRVEELRHDFDYFLIDTPPMSLYSDATLLGQMADGVILVIGSASTRREAARMAKESLDAAGVCVLGAVLNRRTYPIPEAIYRRL